ncbi:DUF1120 domain-containing protein [Pseudomonas tolaasii]|uniref:DUF1120 domain-containing protein n=1 Tax=Pseudomonas tolaasii TaxID=29442 RepID=UPI0015A27370|nr:DUF1120 domain-containing protein [Pseudomonas tolaasii]NVZ46322.1 DUF1120 domain-containing protein [Pseudomonas tolaasii]NWA52561.1 DUF1120 domain-containing protein [Pseudomonas tolaasii]
MSITRNLLVAALMMSAGHAVAASSVDLSVKGTITPSACTPALSNGGLVDFGKLSAKDLRPDQHTYLTRQDLQMTVSCDASTLFAVAVKDNRAGSESSQDFYNFGLGLINGTEKLGYFTVTMSGPMADDVNMRGIASFDGGVTWERESALVDDGLTSVADMNTLAPVPVQRLVTGLQVSGAIAPARDLTLTSEVPLDGSLTMTVVYL